MLNCNLFLWSKLYVQHHYCSLQCHMIFRNHTNMLIMIKKYFWLLSMFVNNSCAAQYFCGKLWYILFFGIHRWIQISKQQHLFEKKSTATLLNVFTVTLDQFNASWERKYNLCIRGINVYDLPLVSRPPHWYPHNPDTRSLWLCHQWLHRLKNNTTLSIYIWLFWVYISQLQFHNRLWNN